MSEDKNEDAPENGGNAEHEEVETRQDKARDKIRKAVDDQQVALAAQQRAAQSTSDAFVAEQELSKLQKEGSTSGAAAATGKGAKSESRRTFLKVGAGVVAGAAIASAVQIPLYSGVVSARNKDVHTLQGQLTTANQEVVQLQGQVAMLQTEVTTTIGFLTLTIAEQAALEAMVETIIPSDSNGPGAKEAGVVYFIDRQLQGEYGTDGNVYMDGPWIAANSAEAITMDGTTYSGATVTFNAGGTAYNVMYPPTPDVRVGAGTRYQYGLNKRDFWRVGVVGVEAYANAAYGGNFENLSPANQTAVLTDMWNNKPTTAQFNGVLPSDFAYELFFLTWSGFLMDPIYGGNQNMVGWTYTAFNGVNMGNFFGEGYTDQQLMVMSTPIALKPVSLGMFQQGSSGSSTTSSSGSSSTSSSSSSTSSSSGSSTATSSSSSSSSGTGSSSGSA